jgi:hypothetical protein
MFGLSRANASRQLPLPVAISRQDNLIAGLERRRDGFEFRGLIAFGQGPGGVQTFWLKKDARPALPFWVDLVGFSQPQQMALRRQNLAESSAESRSQVFGLARLLGDDQAPHRSPLLIRQVSPRQPVGNINGTP